MLAMFALVFCVYTAGSRESIKSADLEKREQLLTVREGTYTDIVSAFGEPDEITGSGFLIVRYNLKDGRKVELNFGTGRRLFVVSEIKKDGTKVALFRNRSF